MRHALCAASMITLATACGDSEAKGIADLEGKPSFAVTLSDYESAGVALIDGDGNMLDELYLSSGSEVPGLSSALHGDIGLPSQPCEEGVLTIVARYGGDYVLQVDMEKGEAVRQIATQGMPGDAAFSSNPQDMLCQADGQALVTRFGPNFDPKAAELDRGDDVVRVDLESEKILSRIDLSSLRTEIDGLDMDGKPIKELAYARPGSMLGFGDFALVGLSRLTASFAAADGLLAVLDLKADKATGVELPGFKNCGTLSKVAGRDDAVIVSCAGYPYADPKTAGLLLVSIDGKGKVEIEETFQAQGKDPVIYSGATSIGGTRVVAVATGDFDKGTPDTAYVLDLTTGEASALFSSASSAEIGSGAFRAETGLLLITDAGKGIRVFQVDGDKIEEDESLPVSEALPARSISPLVQL